MQDILEKLKDIEDSSQYDIGSQISVETMHSNALRVSYCGHKISKSTSVDCNKIYVVMV